MLTPTEKFIFSTSLFCPSYLNTSGCGSSHVSWSYESSLRDQSDVEILTDLQYTARFIPLPLFQHDYDSHNALPPTTHRFPHQPRLVLLQRRRERKSSDSIGGREHYKLDVTRKSQRDGRCCCCGRRLLDIGFCEGVIIQFCYKSSLRGVDKNVSILV
jgi:hypothetical protein